MTDWKSHHPPHDHPDFDAYLNSLTEDDLAAINGAILQTADEPSDPHPLPPAPRHRSDTRQRSQPSINSDQLTQTS
jgi:hypothetical protein